MDWLRLDDFVAICDRVIGRVQGQCAVEIPYTQVYENIQSALGNLSQEIRRNAHFLIKELIVRGIMSDGETGLYAPILFTIIDATNVEPAGDPVANHWEHIVDIIYVARKSLHCFGLGENGLDHRTQERNLGYACKALAKFNVEVVFDNGAVFIRDEDNAFLHQKISGLCSQIGGHFILGEVFALLNSRFDAQNGRFQIYRELSTWQSVSEPEYPWGYLIALGLRHLCEGAFPTRESLPDRARGLQELLELVRSVFVVFEVQPYSPWEGHFIDHLNFFEYMQAGVIFDNLIAFPQICRPHTESLLNEPIRGFLDDRLESADANLRDLVRVGRTILALAAPNQIAVVPLHEVVKRAAIPKVRVKRLLQQFLMFTPSAANQGLAFPPMSTSIDGNFKPAFDMSNDKMLLLPAPLTGLALVNCVYNATTFVGEKFDNTRDSLLGTAFENWVRARFSDRGVVFSSGDFQSTEGGPNGECDAVIETASTIYFVEMKKKGLTRKAMAGHELMLLIDLARSLVFSQTQAMKAEYQIRKGGKITLIAPDGCAKEILLNGRGVERLSISLFDFGSFQDRVSIQQVMDNLYRLKFEAIDPANRKKLADFERLTAEMKDMANRLFQLDPNAGKGPLFRDSVFISAPQLMTVLKNVSSNEDFDREMKSTKWITTSSRDFYREYSVARRISEGATKKKGLI